VVVNDQFSTPAEDIIKAVSFGDCRAGAKECADSRRGLVSALRRFSVAQAEYFFEGRVDRSEWMWNMNWRGRFKRFRLTENSRNQPSLAPDAELFQYGGLEPAKSVEQACKRQGTQCSYISEFLDQFNGLVLH
jgi:hypothetical protein